MSSPSTPWTDERRLAALRTWSSCWTALSRQATQILLDALEPARGLRALDLACGAGEPALSLAAAVGPAAHVVATALTPGKLARLLGQRGFEQVREEERKIELVWPGSPVQLWQYCRETSRVYRPCYEAATGAELVELSAEVCAGLESYRLGNELRLPGQVVLVTGTRP